MAEESHTYPLLEEFVKRLRLPWYGATAVVAAFLLLLLILAAFLDGVLTHQFEWTFWRTGLQSPVIIIYIFAIYPVMMRLWNRAIQAYLSLLRLEESARNKLMAELLTPNRRWEWIAVLLGVVFTLGISQPWVWVDQWLDGYVTLTGMVMFSMLGWLIYNGLKNTRHLAWLNRQQLELDIFDTGSLSPVAHWSLGISLAFLGGISISVVFQPLESLLEWQSIIIYSILVSVTVLIFFISMWGTHSAMARIKRRELAIARKNLLEASHELKEQTVLDPMEGMERLYSAVAAWGVYEGKVREAREWPYNATIIRRLLISVLSPIAVYLIKVLSGLRLGL
jgi:hypothetical protein